MPADVYEHTRRARTALKLRAEHRALVRSSDPLSTNATRAPRNIDCVEAAGESASVVFGCLANPRMLRGFGVVWPIGQYTFPARLKQQKPLTSEHPQHVT
eukprot:363564-Chlamydomonas_euryale.AAC.9